MEEVEGVRRGEHEKREGEHGEGQGRDDEGAHTGRCRPRTCRHHRGDCVLGQNRVQQDNTGDLIQEKDK